jgi:serine/threonine-protein kinase
MNDGDEAQDKERERKLTQDAYQNASALPSGFTPTNAGLLLAGTEIVQVKRYEIISAIGEGGMGWVYRAWDPALERDVAIKVLKPSVPEHQHKRFRQEAVYGARFSYPGIARVYDLVDDPATGSPWFAMEYLSGKDLAEILDRSKSRDRSIPLRLIYDVFRQVLGALGYAHECGVVHRDVKPANMFVTRDPNTRLVTTKLLDFGVALELSDPAKLGLEKQLVGDPRYMAPEQTRLGLEIDHRVDLYAAGMCLYELVTGRHPFEDLLQSSMRELVAAHRERTPIPMSSFMPPDSSVDLAYGLDDVFARACAKRASERYRSAHEMQAALAAVLEGHLEDPS